MRAGRVVTVSIAPTSQGVAGLTYARRSPPGGVPAVRFFACDRDEPAFSYEGGVGIVTGFPGGFVLTQPACVDIVVRQRGRSAPYRRTVPFGVGTCP